LLVKILKLGAGGLIFLPLQYYGEITWMSSFEVRHQFIFWISPDELCPNTSNFDLFSSSRSWYRFHLWRPSAWRRSMAVVQWFRRVIFHTI